MPKFTFLRRTPAHLASGRPVGFGERVSLSSPEVKANADLIAAGALVPDPTPIPEPASVTTKESK